jgi:hypothetical protein
MTRALALLVLIAGAGCNKDDLCGADLGADVVCYTVHVSGDVDPGAIDQLQVDTTYNELSSVTSSTTITKRTFIGVDQSGSDLGSSGLPIAFPLVFQLPGQADESSRVVVTAMSNKLAVGIGTAELGVGSLGLSAPKAGSSHSVDAKLTPASKSDCFNVYVIGSNSDKTDLQCGGKDCQACTQGKGCSNDTDCVAPLACAYSTPRTCQ